MKPGEQKVTKLEALLARSCERLRSTNVLKHGLEYQMTGKVSWINLLPPIHQRFLAYKSSGRSISCSYQFGNIYTCHELSSDIT